VAGSYRRGGTQARQGLVLAIDLVACGCPSRAAIVVTGELDQAKRALVKPQGPEVSVRR
jgi:hypothetical protein